MYDTFNAKELRFESKTQELSIFESFNVLQIMKTQFGAFESQRRRLTNSQLQIYSRPLPKHPRVKSREILAVDGPSSPERLLLAVLKLLRGSH